jgi:hypothetical protein
MKRPIASGLQDVISAIEKLRKISDDCKTQEDEFDFFGEKFSCTVVKDAIATRSDLSTKATASNDG